MFNRKYKKGMADAAKAYEAFGKKQEEALQHILEEVRQGKKDMETALKELNGNIDDLYNHLKSKEKAQLYTVYTPFDIKNLGEQEKLFLVGALYRLTMDKAPNENQQNYLRAIQKYLEIKDPPFGTDPMAIENIEDIPTQKAILQAVLEFLSLQDGDSYDETELQQNFLDAFSVNARGRQEIMDHVNLLYAATGAKGLAEKYGYVPEDELNGEGMTPTSEEGLSSKKNFIELREEFADKLIVENRCNVGFAIETENYCLVFPSDSKSIDKRSGTMLTFQGLPQNICDAQCVEYQPDTVAIESGDSTCKQIGLFHLAENSYEEIVQGTGVQLLCNYGQYLVYGNTNQKEIYLYNLASKKVFEIVKPASSYSSGFNMAAGVCEGILYLTMRSDLNSTAIYRVNLNGTNFQPSYIQDVSIYRGDPQVIVASDHFLYIYSRGGMMGAYARIVKVDLISNTTETLFADDDAHISMFRANLFNDFILCRCNNIGEIKGVNVESGEIFNLTTSSECASAPMRLAGRGTRLNTFPRLGKWIYVQKREDTKISKIDLLNPTQIQVMPI